MRRGRDIAVACLMGAVVAASAFAIVRTQSLKAEPPAVRLVGMDSVVRPGCRCPEARARIAFRLREPARLDVLVVPDSELPEPPVRTLATGLEPGIGRFHVEWDGRDAAGAPAPPGDYRVRIELPERDRAIGFKRTIAVEG